MTETSPVAGRKEWVALAALTLPPFLIAMDLTVLFFAVPSIAASLTPTGTQQLWMIDIYGFLLAGLLIPMGAIGDRIGRRTLLLGGSVVFGIASVVGAFAVSPEMLIAARAGQGIAAATLMPSALALVRNIFTDAKERRNAIAIFSMGVAMGTGVGPVVSGLLLNTFWWGSIFLINVPIVAVLLVAIPILVPEFRMPKDKLGKFDPLSALLSLVAVLALIWGIKETAVNGPAAPQLVSIAVGLLVGAFFVFRQQRLADPLLDLALFRFRGFGPSLVLSMTAFLCVIGFGLFSTQYLLDVLGLRPLIAGLWMLVTPVATGAAAAFATITVNKVRPAYVLAGAFLLATAGFVVMSQLPEGANIGVVIAAISAIGAGCSSALVLLTDLIIAVAAPEKAGAVSALQRTFQELGGAIGIAIFGSIGGAVYIGQLGARLPADVGSALPEAVRETLGATTAAAANLPGAQGAAVLDVAHAAFTGSLNTSAYLGIALTVVAAAVAVSRLRHISYADQQAAAEAVESLEEAEDTGRATGHEPTTVDVPPERAPEAGIPTGQR